MAYKDIIKKYYTFFNIICYNKDMEKLNKKIRVCFIISLLLSILTPLSIVGIVLFANKSTLLLVISIAVLVISFYSLPLLWLHFANLKTMKRILNAIMKENIYSTEEIGRHLQMPEKNITTNINTLIKHMYLKGFLFDGKTLSINKNKKQGKVFVNKCSECGAINKSQEVEYCCPYCGSKYED